MIVTFIFFQMRKVPRSSDRVTHQKNRRPVKNRKDNPVHKINAKKQSKVSVGLSNQGKPYRSPRQRPQKKRPMTQPAPKKYIGALERRKKREVEEEHARKKREAEMEPSSLEKLLARANDIAIENDLSLDNIPVNYKSKSLRRLRSSCFRAIKKEMTIR